MSLLFIESFDHLATADLSEKWSAVSGSPTITAAAGRRSTNGLVVNNVSEYVSFVTSSVTTLVVGVAVYVDAAGTVESGLISLVDTTTIHISVRMNADLTLSVVKGSLSTGTVLGTSTATLTLGGWNYLEFKALINDSTGTYEVRIDGVNVLSGTGADTRNGANATCNTVSIGNLSISTSGAVLEFDDVYICDTSGSINNDFLGDVRVDAYVPDGAGTTTQFTPLSGSNYANVDDATPDDDTTYVESSTVGHIDLYAMTNISHTPSTIHGAQVCMNAKKDDAGAREIKEKCRSASNNYSGTAQALSTSYVYYREIRETDPATSAAWSKANLNSAEFGIEVAS